jgi:hypothetical protein
MIASYLGIIWQYLGCNTQPQNSTSYLPGSFETVMWQF